MRAKRKFLICFVSLLLVFSNFSFLFSANYYICAATFFNKSFAERLVENLAGEGIPSIIDEYENPKNHDTYYRVLINLSFESSGEAKKKCEELKKNPVIQKLDLGHFWICEGDKVKNPAPKTPSSPAPQKTEPQKQENKPVIEEPRIEDGDGQWPEVIIVEPLVDEPVVDQIIEEPIVDEPFVPVEVDLPQEKTAPEPQIVLTQNDENENPLSEETPYSVKIRSYKDEQQAQNDKRRLKNRDIESYILKTYDEKELFSFDLHSGAFATEEETMEYQKELEEKGIKDTSVSDYNDEIEKIERYNEVIGDQEVVFEDVNASIPENFSEDVQTCVKQFPINRDFQIVGLSIYDLDNIKRYNPKLKPNYQWINPNARAFSFGSYRDDLYNKDVTIYLASGDKNAFDKMILESSDYDFSENSKFVKSIDFATAEGVLHCKLFVNDKDYILNGVNDDRSFEILMVAFDFTMEQLTNFLENCYNDSSYLVYPQLRKSLFVLPKDNEEIRRDFLKFELDKIGMDYAKEKGYADWSMGIVGHWHSECYYHQDHSYFTIGFFDMEYDYTAEKIHSMFMDFRVEDTYGEQDKFNHLVLLNGINCWYLLNTYNGFNELSFAVKSYIIAIDSYDSVTFELLSEDDLKEVANDLQVWE